MKKVLFILMALLIAMPAMATVTLTNTTPTSTAVTVGYNYATPGVFPRAFALVLQATGGTITSVTPTKTGVSTTSSKGFGIFPGTIVIDAGGVVTSDGTPVEPTALPGGPSALGSSRVVVALGSLYGPGDANKPANSANLFDVVVSSGTTTLVVSEEDTYRGGVVDVNAVGLAVAPITITMASSGTITGTPVVAKTTAAPAIAGRVNAVRSETFVASGVTGSGTLEYQFNWGDGSALVWGAATQTHTFATATTSAWTANVTVQARLVATPAVVSAVSAPIAETGEAVKSTATFYADWASWTRPNCWAYQRQCKGDLNGVKQGAFWIYTADLSALKTAYGKSDTQLAAISNGICADLNHAKQGAFRVYTQDLSTLKSNYGKSEAQVTICDVATVNFWTN